MTSLHDAEQAGKDLAEALDDWADGRVDVGAEFADIMEGHGVGPDWAEDIRRGFVKRMTELFEDYVTSATRVLQDNASV
jgi:hypothetical protein